MSLLWTFRKLVDPIEHLREVTDQRRHLKPESDLDPDEVARSLVTVEPRAPARRCRVCGHLGGSDPYCPRCLAETMVEVPPARPR